MNFPADARRRFSAAQLAAAEWLILRDNGLSPAQQREFSTWLGADPEHARAFAELDATWGALDIVRELPQASGEADPDSLVPRRRRKSARRIFGWSAGLAAAAALVVVFFNARHSADRPNAAPDFTMAAATEIGGLRTMTLADGSLVRLNTDTAVDVQYFAAERRVKLSRGEAHFTVAKNPDRPFIVSATGVVVRAVGTAFDVRLRPEAVEVLVTEGKVRITDSAKGESLLTRIPAGSGRDAHRTEPVVLVAGQKAVIPLLRSAPVAAVPVAVEPAEVERNMAWQDQRLEFSTVPLAEMVAEFNRYNRHKLVVADPRLAEQCFGGIFRADGYETLVHLLETNHGVVVERREGETILKLP